MLDKDKVHYLTPTVPALLVKIGKERVRGKDGILSLTKEQDAEFSALRARPDRGDLRALTQPIKEAEDYAKAVAARRAEKLQQARAGTVSSQDPATAELSLQVFRQSDTYLQADEETRSKMEADFLASSGQNTQDIDPTIHDPAPAEDQSEAAPTVVQNKPTSLAGLIGARK